ncbi:hypothetical protein [Streptomyces sp. NPDC006739]|uniref:hypothetical protein n=1 Tax=Streptomyces sp. NPDC006739 TaxID=3364763 RepID=UPI003685DC02
MFSRKKIVAVSGFLGGLAVACAGVTQASATPGPGICSRDIEGNVTCIQQVKGETPDGDGFILRQEQTCLPTKPVSLPAAVGNGTTRFGPQITCSNTTPFGSQQAPEKGLDLPALLG